MEITITLTLVTGGYALAEALHLPAPIAMVVAGLLIGNTGRTYGMSEKTCQAFDNFWKLIDEIMTAVLFVMIGLEVLVLSAQKGIWLYALAAIPLSLIARMASVSVPVFFLRKTRKLSPHLVKILTWSGIRGGISIALALSLPAGPHRNFLVLAYAVVLFSIIAQGLTLGRFFRKVLP